MNCPNYKECEFPKKQIYDALQSAWYRNNCLFYGGLCPSKNASKSKLEKIVNDRKS
jgi:hypothetical protein